MAQGFFSPEALKAYGVLVSNFLPLSFSEGETYDFTRCVRPDGSAYGTGGKCRKGNEQAKEPKERGEREYIKSGKLSYKSRVAAEKARRAQVDAYNKTTRKLAEEVFAMTGKKNDGSIFVENGIEGIRNEIQRLTEYGQTESSRLVKAGNLEGLLSHAKKVTDGERNEHVKSRVAEERKRLSAEKAELKALKKKEGASGEETAKALSDQKYYHDKELKKTKVAAEREWYALSSLLRESKRVG